MRNAVAVVGALVVVLAAAVSLAQAASIRNIYFSKGEIVPGQRYRNEGQLPGPVTTFVKGQDKNARLFIIFGDMQAHELTGELKDADGKVVRRFKQAVNALDRAPAPLWRLATHAFGLESLKAGEYALDLKIDGDPKGPYKFSLAEP